MIFKQKKSLKLYALNTRLAQALIESLRRPFWWMIYRMRRHDLLLSYLFNLFFEHVNRFPYLYVCFFFVVWKCK